MCSWEAVLHVACAGGCRGLFSGPVGSADQRADAAFPMLLQQKRGMRFSFHHHFVSGYIQNFSKLLCLCVSKNQYAFYRFAKRAEFPAQLTYKNVTISNLFAFGHTKLSGVHSTFIFRFV